MRIESSVKTRGQRIHSLEQTKFELMDVGTIGQRA